MLLTELSNQDAVKESQVLDMSKGSFDKLAENASDSCPVCTKTVEDECISANNRRFHKTCLQCSSCKNAQEQSWWVERDGRILCDNCAAMSQTRLPVQYITKLRQYVFLLRVALARLLMMLKQSGTLPHTSGKCF